MMTDPLSSLGHIGVWSPGFVLAPAAQVRDAVAEIEDLGYGAIWYPRDSAQKRRSRAQH